MTRRFLIKEIARQAGVSLATVDRVLNGRPGVRIQTVRRVEGAIAELETQSSQLVMSGCTLVLDLVMEAPQYFIQAINDAIGRELPALHVPTFRMRIDTRMHFPEHEMCAALSRIRRRGSDGVILMGPTVPAVSSAINGLEEAGIPVVTLASDVMPSRRHAYVGLNNRQAGITAAWFLRKCLSGEAPRILVTMRNCRFSSEVEREAGFRTAVRNLFSAPTIRLLIESDGKHDIAAKVEAAVLEIGEPAAIYSIGGSNQGIAGIVEKLRSSRPLFIGHDVNEENGRLLKAGKLDLVIHHDFREDVRNACAVFASFHSHGAIGAPSAVTPLRILVPPMLA